MQVPSYIEFIKAENSAAGMSRNLVERVDSWGKLVAIAQKILAEVQNELTRKKDTFAPEQFYEINTGAPLVAASRILDAAARTSSLETEERAQLALCAAAAFSMGGNYPSAHAALRSALQLGEKSSSRMWLAIGCISPRFLPEARIHSLKSDDEVAASAIEDVQAFLQTGEDSWIDLVDRKILDTFSRCTSNIENLLLGYARVSLRHMQRLSTKRSLSKFSSLPSKIVDRLLDSQISTLLPSQHEVLCNSPLLLINKNALICLPTSTGKTLVGEIAIAAALNDKPGLAIFIAPYVAIGLQAARALRDHLPAPYRVHTLVGGLTTETSLQPEAYPEVVVTTPERFDSLLRRFDLLAKMRIVVVDEAHVVSDGVRGVKLEAILSRLRLQQNNGASFRIVCLSAVMTDSTRFRSWLSVPDELFLTCLWRPTARRIALWSDNNKLIWLYAGDELRPTSATAKTIFGTRSLVWPTPMHPESSFPGIRAQSENLFQNVAFLCRQMHDEYGEPILCVCASRGSSRGIAYQLASKFEEFEVLPPKIQSAIDFIKSGFPHLGRLAFALARGIAFHNAALPLGLRDLIEQAVVSRELRIVCATTTLAEGVDLPFRVTILAEWLQWRLDTKDQQRPFGALKFRNIAGRSGRAGVFTEGDTVIFENVLGPSKFADHQNRKNSILSMLSLPSEVASALEEDVLPNELEVRKRVLASSFLAAIPENPLDEALEHSFSRSLLLRELPNGETANQLALAMRADVLSGGDMAFARAASPLRLTPVGQSVNRSLFSPESCRMIMQTLADLPAQNDFTEISAYLIEKLGFLPEQQNPDWVKVTSGSGSRFVVKRADLELVLRHWCAGVHLSDIFSELPSVRNSRARDDVKRWLAGDIASEHWASVFDKFVDFVDTVIEQFLPWVLDACAILSSHLSEEVRARPWAEFRITFNDALRRRHLDQPSNE